MTPVSPSLKPALENWRQNEGLCFALSVMFLKGQTNEL
jgi:hypothetical protein